MKSHHRSIDPWFVDFAACVKRLICFVFGSLGVLIATADFAQAISGNSVVAPLGRNAKAIYSKKSGIQLRVDSSWVGSRGYRPVRVTASMAKAATADTQITIQFFAGSWRTQNRDILVEHDFELPQGATSANAKFLVPQYSDWNALGWDVWVDGLKDENLSQRAVPFTAGANGAITVGELGGLRQNWNRIAALVGSVMSTTVEDKLFSPADLPDTWVDYSMLDVFTTTVDSLEMLRVVAPEKHEALLRWVRAGGNLWILDVGQDFVDLPRLHQIISHTSAEEAGEAAEGVTPLGDWQYVKLRTTGRPRLETLVDLTMDGPADEAKLTLPEIMDSKFPDTAVDSRRWFVARAFGLGTIVALQEHEPTRRTRRSPVAQAMSRCALPANLRWAVRHGNDPSNGNPHFHNWLIADVGAAPVGEFQLLISLFVIGIGPVNYWLLRRRNQLPVLVLTVPLAALVTTLVLFAYGFLVDGIGARVRVRSVTVLDQVAREAASWARLSYYAGIAPSDGLQMPKDTTVYPIQSSSSDYTPFGRRSTTQQRTLEWNNQQQLKGGWLGSRTPTQYLAVTARASSKSLGFDTAPEGLRVTNQLGTDVLNLIVQDHQGNFFLGEKIEPDMQVLLQPCEHNKAAATLRRLLTENLAELPPGYIESNQRRKNYGNSMTESLMELQLEAITNPTSTGWGNGSYLAVTATGLEVPLGLDDVEETNSFHLVRGSW